VDQSETWTPTGAYSGVKTASKSGANGTWYLHVQGKDDAGNESGVVTVSASLCTGPIAVTGAGSLVQTNAATLNGTVNPNGAATTVVFEYGLDVGYGSTAEADQSPLTGTAEQPVSAVITGLTPGKTYHFRVMATNTAGSASGGDQSFETGNSLPSVTTGPVTAIGASSIRCGGTVASSGGSDVTARGVCWGASPDPSVAGSHTSDGTGIGAFDSLITGLNPGTAYHVRAYAMNSAGTAYGANLPVTTADAMPLLEIQSGSGTRAKDVTLPIVLTNIAETQLAAVTVDVGYDQQVFRNPRADIGPAGSTAKKTVASNEVSPGVFRITVFSTSNNDPMGDGVIAYVTLSILSTALANASVLTCLTGGSDPSGGMVTLEGRDGTVTILGNVVGDCNANGTVDIAEVQSAINMYLGILQVMECVDANGNGKVSIGEVQQTINNHLDIAQSASASGKGQPGDLLTVQAGEIPQLDVGQAEGKLGETLTVPLTLTNASGYVISGVSTDLTYDPDVLENPSAEIGPAGSAAGKEILFSDMGAGVIRVGVISAGNNSAIGNGIVAYVSFRLKQNTASAQSALLNAPSACDPLGNDIPMDGTDGRVSVSSSACPECASDPVILEGITFGAGTDCECRATTRIEIGSGVTIQKDARVIFTAPRIDVLPGLRIEPGAIVNMKRE
jgi:hypothetical protein